MTQSRASQISLDDTPYYHCICRCVRRAFLCGRGHYSGQDYEHRRQWVVDRLALLVQVFAVDLCAYAVTSNHYHLVLKIDRHRALSWSSEEVAERWMRLFSGHPLVTRWQAGVTDPAETLRALEIIEGWRTRLFDLGWLMKCLNEYLARQANAEDQCTGRFWESRYKSQALLDDALHGLCGPEPGQSGTCRDARDLGLHVDPAAQHGAKTKQTRRRYNYAAVTALRG
jgi:hypothetical protein